MIYLATSICDVQTYVAHARPLRAYGYGAQDTSIYSVYSSPRSEKIRYETRTPLRTPHNPFPEELSSSLGAVSHPSMNAKKLIKKAIKAAPKKRLERTALEAAVIAQLIAGGKSEKKAKKAFTAKLELPCFSCHGTVVTLTDAAEGLSASTETSAAAQAAPPAKRPRAAGGVAGSTNGAAVRMMDAAAAAAFHEEHRIEVTGIGAESFRPVANFADAGFSEAALSACKSFARPTPIQSCCWPIMMAGRDVIGVAETGSGKTLAFFLPAMMHVSALPSGANKAGAPDVLVLAPTRELAMQSDEVCRAAGALVGLRTICIYGGVPKGPQRQAIKDGARVVVATPGRLLDLEQEGGVRLVSTLTVLQRERKRPERMPGLTSRARAQPYRHPTLPRRATCPTSCSTRRIACSTWASRRTYVRSSASLRRSGAPSCSPQRGLTLSAPWPRSSSSSPYGSMSAHRSSPPTCESSR